MTAKLVLLLALLQFDSSITSELPPVFQVRGFDLNALRDATKLADEFGGTVFLPCGNYVIGADTWVIALGNSQHKVNIDGASALCVIIRSTAQGSSPAIYLQELTHVRISNLSILQVGNPGTGHGLDMGGDTGSGTLTNDVLMENVTIDGFDQCINTSGGPSGTSSEVTFINLTLLRCNKGFNNQNFNGLNYTFIQLQMAQNLIGLNMETAGANVFGGSASNDGTDFMFANDGENVIDGFRSEVANLFVSFASAGSTNSLSIRDCLVTGMSTPNFHTAIIMNGGKLLVEESNIGGQITVQLGATDSLMLRNNLIIDGLNTYTSTMQPNGQGPGFRFINGQGSGARFESVQNTQLNWTGTQALVTGTWPSGLGYIYAQQGTSSTTAHLLNLTQGPVLTVVANAIQPSDYVHHVGNGLIKNIASTDVYMTALPQNCINLIPDAAFTTDTTGNIAKASTAIIGQVMTACFDPIAARWYLSY